MHDIAPWIDDLSLPGLSTPHSASPAQGVAEQLQSADMASFVPPDNTLEPRDSSASIATMISTEEESLQISPRLADASLPISSLPPLPDSPTIGDEGSKGDITPVTSEPTRLVAVPDETSVLNASSTLAQANKNQEDFQFTSPTPRTDSKGGGILAIAKNILTAFSPWNATSVQQSGETYLNIPCAIG